MPYSERFSLVHVAVPKTGTTSVIEALQALHRIHGGELTLLTDRVDRRFRERHGLDALGDPQPRRAKHLSALQLRTILEERWERAFSFSLVRNPWAREVSRYWYTHEDHEPGWLAKWWQGAQRKFHGLSFPEWVERRRRSAKGRGGARNQLDKLTDQDGRILVDFVGRLENLQADFATVCDRIGVPRVAVPHVNSTGGGARYPAMYDQHTRDVVAELYARDIAAFGYRFGE